MSLYDDELRSIYEKGKVVFSKKGILPFLDGLESCRVFDLYEGLNEIDLSFFENEDDE